MLTAEQKRLWLARLRDPCSKQHKGGLFVGSQSKNTSTTDGTLPMCCLGHGAFVMLGRVDMCKDYDFFALHLDHQHIQLQHMNDSGISLSDIANWIEENVLASL